MGASQERLASVMVAERSTETAAGRSTAAAVRLMVMAEEPLTVSVVAVRATTKAKE